MLLGKENLKLKSNFKSHPAYDTARRFPSIGDGLGLTRGNKLNGTKIVNAKPSHFERKEPILRI